MPGSGSAAKRFSKQRERICEWVGQSREHPTADRVFAALKPEFPQLSLGTVYRNLNLLCDEERLIRIVTPEGGDRFDGNEFPHHHMVCRNCGRVYDLPCADGAVAAQLAENPEGHRLEDYHLLFHGTCNHCLSKHCLKGNSNYTHKN